MRVLTTPLTSETLPACPGLRTRVFKVVSVGTAVATNGCSCGCTAAGHSSQTWAVEALREGGRRAGWGSS